LKFKNPPSITRDEIRDMFNQWLGSQLEGGISPTGFFFHDAPVRRETKLQAAIKAIAEKEARKIITDALGKPWVCAKCGKTRYFSIEKPARERQTYLPLGGETRRYLCADCCISARKEESNWHTYPWEPEQQ
jgi:hypothetical protein